MACRRVLHHGLPQGSSPWLAAGLFTMACHRFFTIACRRVVHIASHRVVHHGLPQNILHNKRILLLGFLMASLHLVLYDELEVMLHHVVVELLQPLQLLSSPVLYPPTPFSVPPVPVDVWSPPRSLLSILENSPHNSK